MTIDHPVRRLLARICSPETMSRVVDPTLADMRVEDGRTTSRGYLTLARALALHVVLSAPGFVAQTWSADGASLARAAAACALTTVLLTTPLVAYPLLELAPRRPWWPLVLLMPQAIVLTLPASLLVAIPLTLRGATTRRMVGRAALLSVLCCLATFVLITRVMPKSNQAFRVESYRLIAGATVELERGPNELSLRELREQIEVERRAPGRTQTARQLEYTYQLRYALPAIGIPLGALGLAIALSPRGRLRPFVLGAGFLVVYIFGIFPLDGVLVHVLKRSDAVPPFVLAWIPTLFAVGMTLASYWMLRPAMEDRCV